MDFLSFAPCVHRRNPLLSNSRFFPMTFREKLGTFVAPFEVPGRDAGFSDYAGGLGGDTGFETQVSTHTFC
jgi:hypothetical protein